MMLVIDLASVHTIRGERVHDASILAVWRAIRAGFVVRGERLLHVLPVNDPDLAEEIAVDAFRVPGADPSAALARLHEISMSRAITLADDQLAEAEAEGRELAAITFEGDAEEAAAIAHAAIQKLGAECVAVAEHRFRGGQSIVETARTLGIGRSAVKARERRIRFHIKHALRVRFHRRFGDAAVDHLVSGTAVPSITVERISRRIASYLQPVEPRPYAERVRWAIGALVLALIAVILLGVAGEALAKPEPPKKSPDVEVLEVTKRAEGLLDKLEYERARELLESSVRTLPAYKKAKMPSKARLWVLLGRARSELGDMVGGDEAFLKAVGFDKRVKLTASASPKILEALERARANAPSPAEVAEPEEPEPQKPQRDPPIRDREPPQPPKEKEPPPPKEKDPTPPKEKDPPPPKEKDPPKPKDPPKEKEPPKPKDPPKEKEPPKEKVRPKDPPKEKEPPKVNTGPALRQKVVGEVKDGRTITLVVEHENLPKGSKLELFLRRGQTSPFKMEALTKTGTVAVKKLTMDRPRIELYARATHKKKTVAQLGSENDPIVITTLPAPPLLVEAWSQRDQRPSFIKTSTTGTQTSSASLALDQRSTRTSSTAQLVPPTKVTVPADSSDNTAWIALGVGAGVVVVAAAIVVTVVLLNSGGDDCDAQEGFGCTAIEIVPLVSF